MANLNALAAKAGEVTVALDDTALGEVADLMLRLMQRQAKESGALLPPLMSRSYTQRSESERDGMRAAVRHAILALVLLGYIDAPEL